MLNKFVQSLVNLTQVTFGYTTVAAIIGLIIKLITDGNVDVPTFYLFVIAVITFKINPQLQSLYPFAFELSFRFQQENL